MSDYKPLSDFDLLALLREGDSVAYTEVYNRYYYLLFVFCYKKLRDEELAKDIVQELFANIWEKRQTLPMVNNFQSYLYTAIRNKVFDYISHETVKSKYIQSIADYCNTTSNACTDHLVREKELSAYIDKAIGELPDKMREIFELSRKSKLTYKEIAERLSISERTINNQVSNAISRLRIKLGSLLSLFII